MEQFQHSNFQLFLILQMYTSAGECVNNLAQVLLHAQSRDGNKPSLSLIRQSNVNHNIKGRTQWKTSGAVAMSDHRRATKSGDL